MNIAADQGNTSRHAPYSEFHRSTSRRWRALGASDATGIFLLRSKEAVDQAIAESLKVFLVEADKKRVLYLGMLGHDLRGPLSTIASCATADLCTRPKDSPGVPIVMRSVAQMKALLDDLVEYTRERLGAGLAIDPAPLQLAQFARRTLDEIAAISTGVS